MDDMSGGGSSSTLSSGAARFAAAMDHKRSQAARLAPPPDLAAVAAVDLPSPEPASAAPWATAPLLNGDANAASQHPAAVPPKQMTAAGAGAAGDTSSIADGAQPQPALTRGPAGNALGAAAPQQQPASVQLRTLQAAPANAPQRVRSAMSAALQYRAKKAADTAAAANSAASAAALPPAARRARSGAALPVKRAPSDAADSK